MNSTLISRAALYIALLCSASAHATSPQEQIIFSAPMPHQLYSGGAPVKVHRARLDGYLSGPQGDAAALAELRKQVQSCTKSLADSGRQLRPPTVWPDHAWARREDNYAAANRTILYSSVVGYVVNMEDCSLFSEIVSRADLVSPKGVCKIDLVKKTAEGECDPNGHADAPIPPHNAPPQEQLAKRIAANNPAMAAAMRSVAALSATRTGQQRNILGARCGVWTQPMGTGGDTATLCYAIGGSFIPSQAVNQEGQGGLVLDSDSTYGLKMKAVDVRMDTSVGNAVFTPYAAGGYTIKPSGAR